MLKKIKLLTIGMWKPADMKCVWELGKIVFLKVLKPCPGLL